MPYKNAFYVVGPMLRYHPTRKFIRGADVIKGNFYICWVRGGTQKFTCSQFALRNLGFFSREYKEIENGRRGSSDNEV